MIEYLSKEQVAAMLSTSDRTIDPKTVYRWVNLGLKIGNRRVKLGAIRLPTGMAFTRELVDAFIAELNSVSVGRTTYFSRRSPRKSTSDQIAARVAASVPSRRPRTSPFYRCPDDEIGTYPNGADEDLCVPVVRSA